MLAKYKIKDNSGATYGRVIKILNKKSSVKVGGLVLISVLKNIPRSKIRKGDMQKGVIVTGEDCRLLIKKTLVLVKVPSKGNEFVPLGTRIKVPVNSSLKGYLGMHKLVQLSKRTI